MLLTIDGHVSDLKADGLAVVGLNGKTIEGELDPTNAEIIAMHAEIYKIRPNVGAIIHTHSPNLLAFALANELLPYRHEVLSRWGQATQVPGGSVGITKLRAICRRNLRHHHQTS